MVIIPIIIINHCFPLIPQNSNPRIYCSPQRNSCLLPSYSTISDPTFFDNLCSLPPLMCGR